MEGPGAVWHHGPIARQHTGHLCQQQERGPHCQRTTDRFQAASGVRQGCNLSPLLFVIYMDQITKEANPDHEALNELMFSDDQAMVNNDKIQLQAHTDQLNESCETYCMKISTSKTEVMTASKRPDKLGININGIQLK